MKRIFVTLLLSGMLMAVFAGSSLKSVIRFATVEKATALLNREDDYTKRWSPFDMVSRQHGLNNTREGQFNNTISQLREWTPKEKERITGMLEEIDKNIAAGGYILPLPEEIILIKSTMKDEGGADGYTRANCIVIKDNAGSIPADELKRLLLHETFHVLTRLDSIFRKKMYGIIGFTIMPEVDYPAVIQKYRLTNPDAPKANSYITVQRDGANVDVVMMLYAGKDYTTGEFFDYLTLGFVKLNDKHEVDLTNGKPTIYSFKDITGFIDQVGLNTEYIIDPEEILADNFVFAITDKKGLRSPKIVEEMQGKMK